MKTSFCELLSDKKFIGYQSDGDANQSRFYVLLSANLIQKNQDIAEHKETKVPVRHV